MAYKKINLGISFAGRTETMEQVFGKKDIAPTDMVKILWTYIKKNNLSHKPQ